MKSQRNATHNSVYPNFGQSHGSEDRVCGPLNIGPTKPMEGWPGSVLHHKKGQTHYEFRLSTPPHTTHPLGTKSMN